MEDFKSGQWFSSTADTRGDIFIADDNLIGKIRVMLCFAVFFWKLCKAENNPGSVLWVYCWCKLVLGLEHTVPAATQTWCGQTCGFSCWQSSLSLAWDKKNCFNETVFPGKWECSLEVLTIAQPVPTQVVTFSISAYQEFRRFAHTKLSQPPSTTVR